MLQIEYEGYGVTVGELKKITNKYDLKTEIVKLESKNYKYFEKEFPYPVVDIIIEKKISKAGCYKKGEAIIPTYGIKKPNKVWVSRGCRGIFKVILAVPRKKVVKKPVQKPIKKPITKPPLRKVIKKVQPIVKKPIQKIIKKPVKKPIYRCPPNTRCAPISEERKRRKKQDILQSILKNKKEVFELLEKHRISTGYPAKRIEITKPIHPKPVISPQIPEKVEAGNPMFERVQKPLYEAGTTPVQLKEQVELVEEEKPIITKKSVIKKPVVKEEEKKEDKFKEVLPILAIGGLALLLLGGGESV